MAKLKSRDAVPFLQKARPPRASAPPRPQPAGILTLAVDVGGSSIKAGVVDAHGALVGERLSVPTPKRCTPQALVKNIATLAAQAAPFARVSVGFPGRVRRGVVRTAPNLDDAAFAGFHLVTALEGALRAPVRALNDADLQGLAVVKGDGVELVVTLGTGFGTALFVDGALQHHLEIAHLPFKKDKTFEDLLGEARRKKDGTKRWRKNLDAAIAHLRTLVAFDHLYLGGGNARLLTDRLPRDISTIDNIAGVTGGAKLWDRALDAVVTP